MRVAHHAPRGTGRSRARRPQRRVQPRLPVRQGHGAEGPPGRPGSPDPPDGGRRRRTPSLRHDRGVRARRATSASDHRPTRPGRGGCRGRQPGGASHGHRALPARPVRGARFAERVHVGVARPAPQAGGLGARLRGLRCGAGPGHRPHRSPRRGRGQPGRVQREHVDRPGCEGSAPCTPGPWRPTRGRRSSPHGDGRTRRRAPRTPTRYRCRAPRGTGEHRAGRGSRVARCDRGPRERHRRGEGCARTVHGRTRSRALWVGSERHPRAGAPTRRCAVGRRLRPDGHHDAASWDDDELARRRPERHHGKPGPPGRGDVRPSGSIRRRHGRRRQPPDRRHDRTVRLEGQRSARDDGTAPAVLPPRRDPHARRGPHPGPRHHCSESGALGPGQRSDAARWHRSMRSCASTCTSTRPRGTPT